MADTKTSDESAATTPTGTELVRIVQGGTSKKTTAAVLGHQFRGVRARMSSDDTNQNITTETAISFDLADFDTDSFWSAGSPTRLTIPSGVSYVMVVGQVSVSSSTADTWFATGITHKNSGGSTIRTYGNRLVEGGNTSRQLQSATGPTSVSAGDYFELTAREESDTSITIAGTGTGLTFMSLVVLGMTP